MRLILVALLLATPAAAQSPATGLGALSRVAIEVVVAPDHPGVTAPDLARRLDVALRAARPGPAIEAGGGDVLRLTVAVDRVGATELRGFYLPFSGYYAIGTVRLAVERAVTVPGVAEPVRAVVWLAERSVRGPWRGSDAAIVPLVDGLLAAFLEDYRRVAGR